MENKKPKDPVKKKRRINLIIFVIDAILLAYLIFIIIRSLLG